MIAMGFIIFHFLCKQQSIQRVPVGRWVQGAAPSPSPLHPIDPWICTTNINVQINYYISNYRGFWDHWQCPSQRGTAFLNSMCPLTEVGMKHQQRSVNGTRPCTTCSTVQVYQHFGFSIIVEISQNYLKQYRVRIDLRKVLCWLRQAWR